MQFDKPTLKILRAKMEAALAEVGMEGVSIQVGNCSFTGTEATFKVIATTAGDAEAKAERAANVAKLYGLASTEADGWTIIEYQPRRTKYPFIATNPAGKRYKLSLEQAQLRFGRAAA